jgi:hypothetical protein
MTREEREKRAAGAAAGDVRPGGRAVRAGRPGYPPALFDHGYGARTTKRYLTELRVAFTIQP